jgi:hypothetical protein
MYKEISFAHGAANRRSLFVPLWLAEGYLFITFLMFLVTPLREEAVGLGLLTFFVAACNLAFLGGYLFFFRKPHCGSNRLTASISILRFAIGLAIVWTIAFWVQYYHDTGGGTSLATRLAHPGDSYLMRRQLLLEATSPENKPISRIGQLERALSVLYVCLPVFGILLWSKLGWLLRIGVLAAMSTVVVAAWATGTNEPLGHLAILVVCAFFIRHFGRWPRARAPGLRRRSKLTMAVAVFGTFLAFTLFMGYNLEDRVNARKWYDPRANVGELSSLSFLSPQIREAISTVWFYPANGYCGLSYALQTPFEWTYGVGSSRGIQAYLKDHLGIEGVLERTYPFRAEAEFNWPAGGFWWTMYPWLASDLTFPGVILFMFGLGWACAKTWYECTRLNDLFAAIVFALIFLTIVFEPANVQLLVSQRGVWILLGALSLYFWSRLFIPRLPARIPSSSCP